MAEAEKAYRLIDLYRRFMNGDRLTMRRIIDDYGVNRRTVQRDLEALRDIGALDLVHEDLTNGTRTWSLKERHRKIDITYSIHDVMSLFLGRRMFDFLENTPLEDSIRRVYGQIEGKLRQPRDRLRAETLSQKIYLIHEGPKKLKVKSQDILNTCLDGLLKDEKIKIRYRASNGKDSRCVLNPYTLTAYKRGLYLVARVEEKNEIRVFSLERIRRAEHLKGDKFIYPKSFDPDAYFKSALFITIGTPEPVELRFTSGTKPFIEIRKFHKTQKLKTLKDGRIQMNLRAPVNFETVNFVLSFGKHVEVIKPPSLRDLVREALRDALAQYEN